MNFKVYKFDKDENYKDLTLKEFIFPGGEVGIQVNANDYSYKELTAPVQTIEAHLTDSFSVMKLIMLKDALERFDKTPIQLFLPYVPYARQDRVCNKGEAFSIKVFANLINSLNFKRVIICDPHSEVTPALINNVEVIKQFDIISNWLTFNNRCLRGVTFVAPDAGSNKKTADLAGYFGHDNFIRADKLRDLQTGKIIETVVYADDLKSRDIVIADDICDGGRTFIELAKVLKTKNAGKIILYITHGIFSQGVDVLLENGIDEIYTTDSFKDTFNLQTKNYTNRLTMLSLINLLKKQYIN